MGKTMGPSAALSAPCQLPSYKGKGSLQPKSIEDCGSLFGKHWPLTVLLGT